jgi:hypothetical protein
MDAAQRKTLNRTHIAKRDFKRAGEFIEAAQRHDISSLEYEALMLAAVIYYARPFSNNEALSDKNPPSDRRLKVDAAALLGVDHELHEHILHLRNKAVAHSESKYYYLRIFRSADPSLRGRQIAIKSGHWHPFNEQIDLVAFQRIAHALRTYCRLGRFVLADAVGSERERLRGR